MEKDVVYILKQWAYNNIELRYSLRSLANIEYNEVYFIWYKPSWVQWVKQIKIMDKFALRSMNTLYKTKVACLTSSISDNFILMNDDFIINNKIELKDYHRWTIKEHLEARYNSNLATKPLTSIIERDFNKNDLDFELHCPIIINKQKFLDLFDKYDMKKWHLYRSLYWKEYITNSKKIKDYKIKSLVKLKEVIEENPDFISTRDDFILNPTMNAFLKSQFSKKSKFEIL